MGNCVMATMAAITVTGRAQSVWSLSPMLAAAARATRKINSVQADAPRKVHSNKGGCGQGSQGPHRCDHPICTITRPATPKRHVQAGKQKPVMPQPANGSA